MSRTDKDAPWWVQAEWWEPFHYRCKSDAQRSWQKLPRDRECDLPDMPIRKPEVPWSRNVEHHCTWTPIFDYRFKHTRGCAPRWFRDHYWTNLDRRRKRDECQEARKEHRGTGEVEMVLTARQHRHNAGWAHW